MLFQVEFQASHGRGYRATMSASMLSKAVLPPHLSRHMNSSR